MTGFLMAVLVLLMLIVMVLAGLAIFTVSTTRKIEAAFPPAGHFVDVPGARLHVSETGNGKGPTLLLIHGLGGQMANFTYGVVERLSAQYRVVTVDRPGSGYSVRDSATRADLSTQARAIAALIDKMQMGPTVVAGHSLGGALALTLALEHPKNVAGLALIAPLTHMPEGGEVPAAFKGLTIASPLLRKIVAWTLALPVSIRGRDQILAQVFGPDAVPHDFATRGGGLLGLRPSHFLAASADLQALPAAMPSLMSRYAELRVPVGILYGREDRILDWKINGQAMVDKLPGTRLTLVSGGHMLPVTDAAQTARFIQDVAERVWASQSPAELSGT
ncbi:alpha/beta hydrolase [Noviherbaspirillum sp. Root189]|nr:alpha/beta hydrolase [Noviherbaspirillum sp. Root189]